MSTLSDQFQDVGQELLQEFGQLLTFTRTSYETFNPATNTFAPNSTSTYTAYGFLKSNISVNLQTFNRQDSSINTTVYQILVENNDSYTPAMGDRTTINGVVYNVIRIDRTSVNGDVVLYKLTVQI